MGLEKSWYHKMCVAFAGLKRSRSVNQDDLRRLTKRPNLRIFFDFSKSIFGTDTKCRRLPNGMTLLPATGNSLSGTFRHPF
jgi:hypothetical protein